MDRVVLFSYLRRSPFGGRLSTSQVKGVERLLDAWDKLYPNPDVRYVAYNLATVFHETGGRMQPVRETFSDSDAKAKRILQAAFDNGRLPWVSKPYWNDGYFGRGDIQITHMANYRRIGLRLGIDLVNHPEKALNPLISAQICIVGMVEGLFTNKKLSDYFNDSIDDAVNARRIVNGVDKAQLIASYYEAFLASLVKAATHEEHELPDVWGKDAVPDDKVPNPAQAPGIWSSLVALVGGLFGALTQIENVYALIAVCLVVAALGFLFYKFVIGKIEFRR